RIFSRRIHDLIIEQKNPVFGARNNRLDQDRIVVSRNLRDIPIKRALAVKSRREIAARSLQGLDKGGPAEPLQIFARVFALVTRGAMGAVPRMQKKIVAAESGNARAVQTPAGEEFVGGQRRGGGVVLRIP